MAVLRTRRSSLGLLGAVLAAALLMSGCVQTAMLPAQQLDSGTTVASASLDEPGFLYIPRANVQLTQGVGGGDISVNLSGPLLGGGIIGRTYLSPGLNAELQVQAAALNGEGEPGTGLVLAGVQEAPTRADQWYLGGQLGVIHGAGFVINQTPEVQTRPVVGGSVGFGPIDLGGAWRMQVELEGNAPLGGLGEDDPPLPATRLSIGFFRLFR